MDSMQCKKCARLLDDCPECNSDGAARPPGSFVCSRCHNTGLLCPVHAGDWVANEPVSTPSIDR